LKIAIFLQDNVTDLDQCIELFNQIDPNVDTLLVDKKINWLMRSYYYIKSQKHVDTSKIEKIILMFEKLFEECNAPKYLVPIKINLALLYIVEKNEIDKAKTLMKNCFVEHNFGFFIELAYVFELLYPDDIENKIKNFKQAQILIQNENYDYRCKIERYQLEMLNYFSSVGLHLIFHGESKIQLSEVKNFLLILTKEEKHFSTKMSDPGLLLIFARIDIIFENYEQGLKKCYDFQAKSESNHENFYYSFKILAYIFMKLEKQKLALEAYQEYSKCFIDDQMSQYLKSNLEITDKRKTNKVGKKRKR